MTDNEKWQLYQAEKLEITRTAKTSDEYQRLVRALAERLGI